MYELEEEAIPATRRFRGHDGTPSSIASPAVPFFFRGGVNRTFLDVIRRDQDKQPRQTECSTEASDSGDEEGLDLNALLEKDLL